MKVPVIGFCHIRPPGGTLTYCGTLFDKYQLAHPRAKSVIGSQTCSCGRPYCPRCVELRDVQNRLRRKERT